jgi:hypothetical protein
MLAAVLIVTGFVLPWTSFDSSDAHVAQVGCAGRCCTQEATWLANLQAAAAMEQ